MKFLKLTFIATFALLPVAHSQDQAGADGLPPGWEKKAEETVLKDETDKPTNPKGEGTYNADEVKEAIGAMPPGKYIGELPAELYFQLADGNEAEEALKLLKKWEERGKSPLVDLEGKLKYTFGSGTPLIVSKPVELTDIELEKGEEIADILIGDNVRWTVTPTMSGDLDGLTQTSHLVIKAKAPDITTSLLVTTNRRSYRMRLVSSAVFHMPYVGFEYPDSALHQKQEDYRSEVEALKAAKVELAREREQQKLSRIKELERRLALKNEALAAKQEALKEKKFAAKRLANPLHLDFLYRVERTKGRPSWKPSQVYNDGRKTYVVMPESMAVEEAPILLIKGARQREMVNYRVVDNKFVVDRIFDEAVLVSGVGWHRQEVTIERTSR